MDKSTQGISKSAPRRKSYGFGQYLRQSVFYAAQHLTKYLSPSQRLMIREKTLVIDALDYEKADIHLTIESLSTLKRTNACAKEPSTVEWIENNMKPHDVFYDIGANVGAYSLVAAKQGHPTKVYAFEPSYSTYANLCDNIILNQCQNSILPFSIPLSSSTGTNTFFYQSVAAGAALHSLGKNMDSTGEDFEPSFAQQVISFSLDDLVDQFSFHEPNLVKMDVDGTELDVLQGGKKTFRSPSLRSALIEIDPHSPTGVREKILKFMEESGFDYESTGETTGSLNYVFARS